MAAVTETHDLVWAAIVTGGLALAGIVATLLVTTRKLDANSELAKEIGQSVIDYLDTGNGHTAGQSLSRLEERAFRTDQRVDGLEVRADEAAAAAREAAAHAQEATVAAGIAHATAARIEDKLTVLERSVQSMNDARVNGSGVPPDKEG